MATKQVHQVALTEREFQWAWQQLIAQEIGRVDSSISRISEEVQALLAKDAWLRFEGKDIFYNHSVCGLFPNLKTFELGCCTTYRSYNGETFKDQFAGFTGSLMTIGEFQGAFANQLGELNRKFGFPQHSYYTVRPCTDGQWALNASGNNGSKWDGHDKVDAYHIPIFRLAKENTSALDIPQVLLLWFRHELIPLGLSKAASEAYTFALRLYRSNLKFLVVKDGRLQCERELVREALRSGEILGIEEVSFQEESVRSRMKSVPPESSEVETRYRRALLACDTERADRESYEEKLLLDPNRGHWDLWESLLLQEDSPKIQLKEPLMARNPVEDVRSDGFVGIDFGTKSTVVAYQERDENTMLMRVGTGVISKKVESSDYENPTVMQLLSLDEFMERYREAPGRPKTLWKDITTSHSAFGSFMASSSKDYYSFLSELKQWAGEKEFQLRIRDKKGTDLILQPFLSLSEEDFNPIEIYAYYVGLYINNMTNGIYLDYILSYPVTYEKAVQEAIITSFERGLRKSLPSCLLENQEAMKRFGVKRGASEPVAYALCALAEYGFDLEGEEKVFYGVFDFGGGTTDFDFGLYEETGSDDRRYDYVVRSFGGSGDPYLGGENILELLAFEVFKANQDLLREKGITFVRPFTSHAFPGSEALLSKSEEAKLNTAQLKEILRPFWERHEGYQKIFEPGVVRVNLGDKTGGTPTQIELKIDAEELDRLIRDRIERGVENFFDGLAQAFNLPQDTHQVDFVNIFLAGNSSKDPRVTELFLEYMEKFTERITRHEGEPREYFAVFPPLGTEEARKKQEERGVSLENEGFERPTGKTGVAFGLLKSRPGGKIQLITERAPDQESKFAYYIGYEKKGKFRHLTDRNIVYLEWHDLVPATEVDFSIYCTPLPECIQGKLSIRDASIIRKKGSIERVDPKARIFFRAVTPTEIEYTVAYSQEDVASGRYCEAITRLSLGG